MMHHKICVLGGGSWGSAIAAHLSKKGLPVSLWEYSKPQAEQMKKSRTLSFLPQLRVPESVQISSEMDEALQEADIIFSAVPSQFVRQTWKTAKKFLPPSISLVVSLTKGIEKETLKRMSEVIIDEFPKAQDKIAVLSGPSHAEEVAQEIPTAVTAASAKKHLAETVQKILVTPSFRVYTNPDVVGVEVCGAIKNIFAISCGACDGLGLGDNTKAALVTRGLAEMSRLGARMGGEQATFFGLAGMGDLVVTCFSKHSRNRNFGEMIGQGKSMEEALKKMTMVAEGVPTSESAYLLAKKFRCDCPIINEVYRVLYEGKNVRKSIHDLMNRPMRGESEMLNWK